MNYIELFSGIGGFRQALELLNKDTNSKFRCKAFSEIDQFAKTTYSKNFKLNGEIRMDDINEFASTRSNIQKIPEFKLLVGGFPCQAFSLMGKQEGLEDERGKVLFSIDEILRIKKPEYIILENVRNLAIVDKGKTLEHILDFFRNLGYKYVKYVLLDTKNFGLPQRRVRIFFVCSRNKPLPDLSEEKIIKNFKSIRRNSSLCTYRNVRSILKKQVDVKYFIKSKTKKIILADGSKNFWSKSEIDLPIARTLTATMAKMHRACQDNYYSEEFIIKGISNRDKNKNELMNIPIRRLTPEEALKLQGFSNKFCINARKAGISDTQLYKQAGNALSVNTAYALLHYLFIKRKRNKK